MSDRTRRPVGDRTGRPVKQRNQEAQTRTLLDKQKEQILAECQARINQHEFQAARAEEVQQRDQQLLQGQLLQQNWELREAHQRSLTEMEELRKFQSCTFDTIARRKSVEDQNTFLELSGRIQELQNEINCMSNSKEFQDAESIRSGNSHVASRPVSFPPHPIPEGMLSRSCGVPSRRGRPPSIWDTHGISGNVFAKPDASSSARYPQELHQWNSSIEEPLHSSTVEKSERQKDQDLRCQSGPSAKNSVIFSGGDYSKNYGADQQRLQISDLHFDKFPTPAPALHVVIAPLVQHSKPADGDVHIAPAPAVSHVAPAQWSTTRCQPWSSPSASSPECVVPTLVAELLVLNDSAQKVYRHEELGERSQFPRLLHQRVISALAQCRAGRRIPMASSRCRQRQRRACDLRPRASSKRSFWVASSGPSTSMPVVPSRSLGFLQRKQLARVPRSSAKVEKRSSAADVARCSILFLRVLALGIPEASLHSGRVAHCWVLRLRLFTPPPLQRCRDALWSSRPSS